MTDIHDTKQILLEDGRPARQILGVTPLEVSPVMQAAGIGTRTIDALAADAPAALAAINTARAKARAGVGFAGQDAPDANADPDRPLIIDADATLLTAHPEKEQAAPTFKRGFGFHPLWAAAGLRVGDIVVAVDGKPIPSAADLQRLMVEDAIGKPVEITIWRNGALVDVIAVPRELDSSA